MPSKVPIIGYPLPPETAKQTSSISEKHPAAISGKLSTGLPATLMDVSPLHCKGTKFARTIHGPLHPREKSAPPSSLFGSRRLIVTKDWNPAAHAPETRVTTLVGGGVPPGYPGPSVTGMAETGIGPLTPGDT